MAGSIDHKLASLLNGVEVLSLHQMFRSRRSAFSLSAEEVCELLGVSSEEALYLVKCLSSSRCGARVNVLSLLSAAVLASRGSLEEKANLCVPLFALHSTGDADETRLSNLECTVMLFIVAKAMQALSGESFCHDLKSSEELANKLERSERIRIG